MAGQPIGEPVVQIRSILAIPSQGISFLNSSDPQQNRKYYTIQVILAFMIACRPSVCKFFLHNHQANFNQSLHKASFG